MKKVILVLLLCLGVGIAAEAAVVTVVNPSFEDFGIPFDTGWATGWDSIGIWSDDLDHDVINEGSFGPGPSTLKAGGFGDGPSGCGQDLSVTIGPNTTYTVTYDFMLSYAGDEGGSDVTSTVTFYSKDGSGFKARRGSVDNTHPADVEDEFDWVLNNTASFTFYGGTPGVGDELGIWLSYSGINPWAGYYNIRVDSAAAGPLPTFPLFRKQPESVTVAQGQTAEFSVMVVNVVSYAWKKEGSGSVLSTTDTLTISNVQDANEGYYYCEATNGNGTTESLRARLLTERLMGHWKFENDLDDELADNNGVYIDPCGITGTPSYASGIVDGGQAIVLSSADPNYVEIPDANDFEFYPQGYTVSCWIKTDVNSQNWGGLVSQYMWDAGEGWTLVSGAGVGWHGIIGLGGQIGPSKQLGDTYGQKTINDGQWHFVVGTYDANTGTARLYVDGEPDGEVTGEARLVSTLDVPVPLMMGTYDYDEDVFLYTGLLDDVKIYSYPRTGNDIAVEYTTVESGKSACVEYLQYDINGDCKVTMEDFAAFAEGWRSDNIIP